jgi:2-methylcitrate dehydratase PrpD
MQNPTPRNTFAARYSFPHAAAALVIKGHAGYDAFTEEAVHDPAMAALRQRVHLTADPELSAQAPRLKPARVTLTLKDGRQETRLCESARGDFQRPYAESEIRAKFHQLAAIVLTQEGVTKLETSLDGCDQWAHTQELTEVIRNHSRPATV